MSGSDSLTLSNFKVYSILLCTCINLKKKLGLLPDGINNPPYRWVVVYKLGSRDLNPKFHVQSVTCCRYTTPQYGEYFTINL